MRRTCLTIGLVLMAFSGLPAAWSNEAKLLKVAAPLHSPPFIDLTKKTGIEMAKIERWAQKLGYRLEWQHFPPKRNRRLVKNGEVDMAIRLTKDPNSDLCYTGPYISFQNVAVYKDANVRIQSIDDLSRYSVVAFQNAREALGSQYREAVGRSPFYLEIPDQERQLDILYKRENQVLVIEKTIFHHFKDKLYPDRISMTAAIFPVTSYSLAFRDPKLCQAFDKLIAADPAP